MINLKGLGAAAAIAGGALCLSATAHAEDAVDWTLNVADCPSGGVEVEKADAAVLKATEDALKGGGGFAVLKARLPELEAALSHAPTSFQKAVLCGDKIYVHSAGNSAQILKDLLVGSTVLKDKAAADKMLHGRPRPTGVEVIASPYPQLSFYVGTTYVEMRRFDRALAALDKGLALDPFNPILVNEAAQAYIFSHRPEQALGLCERALSSGTVTDPTYHALLLRTRGLALGELNRFAEAEHSYRDSLTYDPGNRGALNEIRYYQQRQAGAKDAPVEMTTSDKFKTNGVAGGKPADTPQQ